MLSVNWSRDITWKQEAACKGHLDEFYPEGSNHTAATLAAVQKYCDRCSVREACLDWALTQPEDFGIWGGLDIGDRKRLQGRGRPLMESRFASMREFGRAGAQLVESEVHLVGQEHR
jgi:WhiB family redox-sensing transcriptional regulator